MLVKKLAIQKMCKRYLLTCYVNFPMQIKKYVKLVHTFWVLGDFLFLILILILYIQVAKDDKEIWEEEMVEEVVIKEESKKRLDKEDGVMFGLLEVA